MTDDRVIDPGVLGDHPEDVVHGFAVGLKITPDGIVKAPMEWAFLTPDEPSPSVEWR